ncbi:MAG: carbohydrate-binding family 9-like protein [Oscillospiraceae bacterium]|nr:carbohydrate-binding family 9-like protein [Oscillospiraceae bacterium]
MPDNDRPLIQCPPIATHGGQPTPEQWDALPAYPLRLTRTGAQPRYSTIVQTAYDPTARLWFIRFDGEDPSWVSDYTSHDETIWTQDVFEVFYDDTGSITADLSSVLEYKELESSPRNVRFDANIVFTPPDRYRTDTSWDIDWNSLTAYDGASKRLSSVWMIPFASLSLTPAPNVRMPINFYRIDRGPEHESGAEFTAWSPTLNGSFHTPRRFGTIEFT